MALFENQISEAVDYLERQSSRDRILLLISIAGIVLLLTFFASYLIDGRRRNLVADKQLLTKKLEQILRIQGQFLQARRRVRALERRIQSNPVKLIPYLDRLSQKFKINITSMNPISTDELTPGRKNSRIRERAVKIQLQAVSLASLARFLDAIENSGKIVKIRRLQLRPNFSEPSKPDVNAVVSTYILKTP